MSLVNLVPDDDPYTRIPRETATNRELNADGLAVLTYLRAHGHEWEPRDRDIRARFRWGRDKMRGVWGHLVDLGYAQRRHRVRQPNGTFRTVTDVATRPYFKTGGGSATDGSAVGGQPTGGPATGGEPTTNKERNDEKKNNKYKKQPIGEADGKTSSGPLSEGRLIFENEFGFEWSSSHQKIIDETRACAIFKRERIEDAGTARRIVAEWAAMTARRPDGDHVASLVWACRNQLAATAGGDERLPAWA